MQSGRGNSLHEWNRGAAENKWAVEGIYVAFWVLPVYPLCLVADLLVFNSIEWWGGENPIDDYSGLYARAPVLAGSLATLMVAMGGIPMTAGFVGKLGVFQAAAGSGYLWLVVVGVISAAAGLYFYLRVIVVMFFQPAVEGPGAASAPLVAPRPTLVVILIAVFVTVGFGLVPWPLLNWVQWALPL